MAELFVWLSTEEPAYRRISLRTSFLSALISAFITGAETVRIFDFIKDGGHQDDLVLEVAYLVLWLAVVLRWGRGAWETANQQTNQMTQGGTA